MADSKAATMIQKVCTKSSRRNSQADQRMRVGEKNVRGAGQDGKNRSVGTECAARIIDIPQRGGVCRKGGGRSVTLGDNPKAVGARPCVAADLCIEGMKVDEVRWSETESDVRRQSPRGTANGLVESATRRERL